MGGQAFVDLESAYGPIVVPRMPPATYQAISLEIQSKLRTLFSKVVIPREAPAKVDHGDIDFLVGGIIPCGNAYTNVWDAVQMLLNAQFCTSRGGSHSFGIKHPHVPNAYVQIDVELAPGDGTPDEEALFEWTRFMKGDSDLVQIIGICHRHLGLTCNDLGLHLRVAEIEPYDKKKSLLFLTRDPAEAMALFGFDADKYHAGFQGEDALFHWVTEGRFFSRSSVETRVEKHNDRSRLAKRPMFRRFVLEFMPSHPEIGQNNEYSREQVLEEALGKFSKHGQYKSMMAAHHEKETEEAVWNQVRGVIPAQGSGLALALKGLRRWVDFADGKPHITSSCVERTPFWSREMSAGSMDTVLSWVAENWQTTKSLEKKRAKEAKASASNNVGVQMA